MKLNRFLFLPSSPPPSPSPFPDVLSSLLQSQLLVTVVGATKAATIATAVLVAALLLLSLFFFPGPTLLFLRWLAVSCFYVCVCAIGLLWLTCRCLFVALAATCRCLLSFSDDYLLYTARRSSVSEYTPLLSQRTAAATTRVTRPPPSSRHAEFRYSVPPENGYQRGAGVGQRPPGNCGGAHRKTAPNYSENQRHNDYTNRQKMKESDEYKRAMAAEWAARQQEIHRQAEEARRQRSKKAENKRSKANDQTRPKQRTDQQNPETSRRKEDERLNNEKERIREEIRQKLMKLQQCGDMASLLRSLGINIPSNPSSKQIRDAYREACKKYHPDRLARADLRHQIEAEEKFKLISAMKDNCSSF